MAPCRAPAVLSDTDRRARAVRGPERRAAGTAMSLGADASPVDALRAWSSGKWSGRPIDEVAREHPDAFGRWRTDPSFAPPGGESLDALLARVGRWLDSVADGDGRLVVVDTTVVTAAVVHALAAPTESFWHLDVAPLSVSRLNRTAGTWRLRTLGIITEPPGQPPN